MFKRILVPLDGSKLAEVVLPVVRSLAEGMDAAVILLHMIERKPPSVIHGDRHLTQVEEALTYLEEVRQRAFSSQMRVETHVHDVPVENVAESITQHVQELHPDLIVMCNHGKGGVRDWLVGSMAQQVIAFGSTPVLLIKAGPDEPVVGSPQYKKFLVALDGEPDHEECLQLGGKLAQHYGAALNLVMVVQNYSNLCGEEAAMARLLPVSTAAMLDMAEVCAVDYLQGRAQPWLDAGMKLTIIVERGEPVQAILDVARRMEADMIVVGTHGRSGMSAFWAGSVGTKIISQANTSLFLVPVGGRKN